MATAGSIVVSLLMNTGSFETDTKRAESIAKKRSAEIDKAFEGMGQNIAIAASVAGTALVAMITSTASAAKEISNLSQISGAGVTEFQRFAAGAKSVGLEQDKLGDIFKDFREKVGEFVATGGGGMKDFFEQVAPKIGITADAFLGLSGPDALQLYISSLEKANLSQEEMSFYLESMASDTTALIPLLRNGGTEMKRLGDEAERTGKIMDKETVASAKLLSENMETLKNSAVGVRDELALQLIPTLNGVFTAFNGAQTGAKSLAEFFGGGLKVALEATSILALNVAFTMQTLGDTIGAYAAVSERLVKGDVAGAKAIGDAYKAMSEDRRKALDNAERRILKPPIAATYGADDQSAAEARRLGLVAPTAWTRPNPVAPTKPGKAQKPGKDNAVDYSELDEITKQFDAIYEDRRRKQQTVQDEAARIYESTRTPLERLNIEQANFDKLLSEGAITWDTYSRAVLDAEETYRPFSETLKASAESGYWDEWLKSAEKAMLSFDDLAAGVAQNFSSQFGSAFESVVFDSENLGDAIHGMAEGMMRAVVNALGQMAAQWLAYQAVQMLVGKSTAVSAATAQTFEAMASQQMAALNSFAATAAIPIVGPALAPAAAATALAATSPFVATIASLGAAAAGARADGGPVMGSTPYLVGERGAELFVPNTSGAIVPNHKLGGGAVTINLIENRQRAGQTEERTNNGAREVDMFVADIMGDGPRSRAMKQAFGLQRRGY